MKRKIFLAATMLMIAMISQAQKFALIDTEYIFERIPAYQQADQQLQDATQRYQAEVEKVAKEAQKMFQDYQSIASTLNNTQKTAKEDAIVEKEKKAAELRRKYFGPEGELAKLREKLITPIQDSIYETVKSLSMEQGYDLIIDRASATGVIFAQPRIDISDEILRRLGYSN